MKWWSFMVLKLCLMIVWKYIPYNLLNYKNVNRLVNHQNHWFKLSLLCTNGDYQLFKIENFGSDGSPCPDYFQELDEVWLIKYKCHTYYYEFWQFHPINLIFEDNIVDRLRISINANISEYSTLPVSVVVRSELMAFNPRVIVSGVQLIIYLFRSVGKFLTTIWTRNLILFIRKILRHLLKIWRKKNMIID